MKCRQRWIVEAPIGQVVKLGLVNVPFGGGQMASDFLPVALRFVVAIHGRLVLARVLCQRDDDS